MKQCFAILLVCALTGRSAAQKSRLIDLDVQVFDARTQEIPELLGPKAFEVYDNGQKIPIQNLAIDTPPMDLVFLIYFSKPGLSTPLDRQRYRQGLEAAVTTLRPDDRAGVVRGSGTRGISLHLTADSAAIRQALLRGTQPDRYRLLDAVAGAMSLLAKRTPPGRRRAIIAISDDIERHSETKETALETDLLTAGITLHEVMLALTPAGGSMNASAPWPGGPRIPRISGISGLGNSAGAGSIVELVRATGGESKTGDNFDTTLPALIERLKLRYTLTVEVPAADPAFHRIEVRLTPKTRLAHPDARVRTRTGYFSQP